MEFIEHEAEGPRAVPGLKEAFRPLCPPEGVGTFESHPPHISFTQPFLNCTMNKIEMVKVFSFPMGERGLWAINPD